MKIKANGISMNYEIKGQGENLVLIHGAGDNLKMWYHQVPVFSKSFRVITYDVRGFGQTEITKGDYTMPLFAEDLYQLMQALGVKSGFFLGYSMGGRIALELALKHPEIVKALVIANSAVHSTSTATSPKTLERRRATMQLMKEGKTREATEIMTAGALSPGFRDRNPTEFERYMKVKLQNKPEGYVQVMSSLSPVSAPVDLTRIKCPVLFIAGDADGYTSVEDIKLANKAVAGSKMVVLHTGHAAAIEMPHELNSAVLEFLAEAK